MSTLPAILITGASSGIGATYAERFARRGHDLLLVARDEARLEALARRLTERHSVAVAVIRADLTDAADLAMVEARLREDSRIGVLINNAGMAQPGRFVEQTSAGIDSLLALNINALTRLAEAGEGAIVNIGSVVGLAPEFQMPIYGASKAYVLFLSQALALELGPMGVYVQAVLPAATRTEIWERSGMDISAAPEVMEVEDLVDAALVGFDRREAVTIPPLQVLERWEVLDAARQALLTDLHQGRPAERYTRPA